MKLLLWSGTLIVHYFDPSEPIFLFGDLHTWHSQNLHISKGFRLV